MLLVLICMPLVLTQMVAAQEDGPPLEVLHCARPFSETILPAIVPVGAIRVALDRESKEVVITLPAVSVPVTCYAVRRAPAETGPITIVYDAAGVAPANIIVRDPIPPYAGQYCYSVVFGNTLGHSDGDASTICIDIPEDVAPPPPPPPTPERTPVAPGAGPDAPIGPPNTGATVASDSSPSTWPIAVAIAAAVLGAAGIVLSHHSRR